MAEVRTHRPVRPREISVALGLAIAAFSLWLIVDVEAFRPGDSAGIITLIALGFYLGGAIRARKGRKDTRIGIVVSLVVLYFFMLPYCWLGFHGWARSLDGPSVAVLDIVATSASAAGLVLCFLPSSRRYFHLVTVAREARRGR
ncbi:hypothetical protein [Amycolatopsis minnesotensis]|uniref:SPW repeat-containing protein n=1 Tax=Amycolatopsis minnesotensis TaxID=337894 RepID=A0ABN2QBJ4_9PSEU